VAAAFRSVDAVAEASLLVACLVVEVPEAQLTEASAAGLEVEVMKLLGRPAAAVAAAFQRRLDSQDSAAAVAG
jgi:hypothetical protein